MNEYWKDIPNYEGLYQASDLGRIKALSTIKLMKGKFPFLTKERILNAGNDGSDYLQVVLTKNNIRTCFKVHILIGMTWKKYIPNKGVICLDHSDSNKQNNAEYNLKVVPFGFNIAKERRGHSCIKLKIDNNVHIRLR